MYTKPNNRRGRRRGGPGRRENKGIPNRPKLLCALCGEVIRDITSALTLPSGGEATHFDCGLKSAEEDLKPEDGEKVIYLGKDSFAIVEELAYSRRKLKIIKHLDRGTVDDPKDDWRKKLRSKV